MCENKEKKKENIFSCKFMKNYSFRSCLKQEKNLRENIIPIKYVATVGKLKI